MQNATHNLVNKVKALRTTKRSASRMGARVFSPSSGARPGARALNLELPTSLGSAGISTSVPVFVALLLGGLTLNLAFSHSAYAAFSASISRSGGTVSLAEAGSSSIRPTSTGTLGTGSDKVSVATTCTYGGYKLYVSATSTGGTNLNRSGASASELQDASNYITTSTTTTGSETTLSRDTWGVGKTASAFSGLQAYNADAGTLKAFYTGTSTSDYTFYYGVNVSTAKTPGTYTGEVLYTVLMDEACTKYTLNFDGNGATTNNLVSQDIDFDATIDLAEISSTDKIARTGYKLTGWKDQNNNSYGITGTADINPNDRATVTLTAQWEQQSYAVTVNKGTNVTTVSGADNYTYDSQVTITATAFSTGYHFGSWTVDSGGVTLYSDSSMSTASTTSTPAYFKMPDNAVTVTANAAANTYTIAYNANGGSGTAPASQSGTYGSDVTLRANTFTRDGYSFLGWSTNSSDTSSSYDASKSYAVSTLASVAGVTNTNGGTINLYAIWESAASYTYTLSYSGVDFATTNKPETQTYTGSETSHTFTIPSAKPTYSTTGTTITFSNYTYNGTTYNPGSTITLSSSSPSATITANWTRSCTISSSTGCKLADNKTWIYGNSGNAVTWNNLCTSSDNCKASTYCPSGYQNIPTRAIYNTLVSSYSGGALYQILGLSGNRAFWSSTENSSGTSSAYDLNVASSSAGVGINSKTVSRYVLCYK